MTKPHGNEHWWRRCPHVFTEGPRIGERCNRRHMTGEACERHRPKITRPSKPLTPEQNRAAREKARKKAALAGVPSAWRGAV